MSNVITLNVPHRRQSMADRTGPLIETFATHRRFGDDVFWLKENAELLNILECTGADVTPNMLIPHGDFYRNLPERLSFFPQYYRFLLSICLDLEDLGMAGTQGEALCHWVADQGLPLAELSDLQRAEARRILARRGASTPAADVGLDARLHGFIDRPETFALPNKKAAYELTHIVFYLSEYGRRDPELSVQAITSLEFAGVLAFLDQNADLLAEICIALRYAGRTPSPIWENFVMRGFARFDVAEDPAADVADDYHEYFVSGWLAAIRGDNGMGQAVSGTRTRFRSQNAIPGPLRTMSACMFQMNEARSGDWTRMRPLIEGVVDAEAQDILALAERSTERFGEFFQGFARAAQALA